MYNKEWKRAVTIIRKVAPVDIKVDIRRYPCKKYDGSTRFNGSKAYVRINSKATIGMQVDTLLHEWAHVLMFNEAFTHGPTWGQFHASLYSATEGLL